MAGRYGHNNLYNVIYLPFTMMCVLFYDNATCVANMYSRFNWVLVTD